MLLWRRRAFRRDFAGGAVLWYTIPSTSRWHTALVYVSGALRSVGGGVTAWNLYIPSLLYNSSLSIWRGARFARGGAALFGLRFRDDLCSRRRQTGMDR